MRLLSVGRSTFDLGYVCARYPAEDTKVSSTSFFNMAGGPALNAAVTYAALGGKADLWTVLGEGPLSTAVKCELDEFAVRYRDFAAGTPGVLPVSSIVVVPNNSSRTIFDQHPAEPVESFDPSFVGLVSPELVLTDGFLPDLAEPALGWARGSGITTVLDGGSWKDSTERIINLVDVAIVSDRFRPPGCNSSCETVERLHAFGVRRVAVTRGPNSIIWSDDGNSGEIIPPKVSAIDTLGAGDVFHGAYCYYFAKERCFQDALSRAAKIAAASCKYWGTRDWILNETF